MTSDHGKLEEEEQGAAAAEPVVHKVPLPVRSSFGSDARSVVRETFFHTFVAGSDGGWFKAGRSRPRQAFAALQCVFPILDWLSSYAPRIFFQDLLAGLTTASLAVPQVVPAVHSSHQLQYIKVRFIYRLIILHTMAIMN